MTFLSRATGAFFVLSAPAFAQTDHDTLLDPIIVSGGLTPIESDRYGRAVSVLTADDLTRRGVTHVAEALRALPGVSVNAAAGLTQVRMRGAEGNHTLVLIDGIEANDPNTGEFDFSSLLAADIDRIEVLRGPQSSIYGSNAIGGVIAITTKTATRDGVSAEVTGEIGDDVSRNGMLAVRHRSDRARLSFSAAYDATDGYDVSDSAGGKDDGSDNTTLNARVAVDVTAALTLGATLRQVSRTTEFDQFNYAAASKDDLVTEADLEGTQDDLFWSVFAQLDTLDGRLTHDVFASEIQTDYEGRTDGDVTTDTSGERQTLRYRGTLALDGAAVEGADHTLSAMVERQKETFRHNDASLVFDPEMLDTQDRTLNSYVLEYRGSFVDAVDLQGSVRYDDNDQFEDFTTWSLGASWRLSNGTTRLHASAGTGVQNPTLTEQFGYFPGSWVGNPDLEPEQSRGWDVGVEQAFYNGMGLVDVTYFEDVLTNEISSTFDPVTYESTPYNMDGDSDRRGVEVAASLDLPMGLFVQLDYTWLDADDSEGDQEVRRPEHEIGLHATYALPDDRTRLGVDVRHVRGVVDFDYTAANLGERVGLDDYTVVDLTADYAINERLTLTARISNLTDEDYEETYGYATQGRAAYVGFRAAF